MKWSVHLADFLYDNFVYDNITTTCWHPILVARNRAMRDCVLPFLGNFDEFFFFDSDIEPTENTQPFLVAQNDVVGCRCSIGGDHSWAEPTSFHHGIFRIKSYVLRKLQLPLYDFKYSADGCELLECECNFLKDKILAAGFSIVQAGHADHPVRDSTWE